MSAVTSRAWLVGLVLWAAAPCQSFGQEPRGELLNEVRQRERVLAQRVEQEIKDLITDADKNPKKAADLLRKAMEKLEGDTTLSETRRSSLAAVIRKRLKAVETAAHADTSPERKRRDSVAPIRSRVRNSADESEAIREAAAKIRQLRKQGQMKEAERVADELVQRFPDSRLVRQIRQNTSHAENLHEATRLMEDRGGRISAAMRDVDRSASPPAGDIVYSPDFLAKSEKRKARYGGTKLTAKETEIMRSLNEPTSTALQIKDLNFDKVIELLQKELGQPLIVDKSATDELKIDYELPIRATVPKGVSKRTMLRTVLSHLGLTYIVKNETIEVTSVMRAQETLTVRYYQMDDFLAPGTPVGLAGVNPAAAADVQKQVDLLIDMIQRMVDPGSWKKNGGPGSISYYAPTRTLIIKNSAEVHNSLGGGTSK